MIDNNEYNSIDPCPALRINRSLLSQSGQLLSNFRNFVNRTVATSAIPIGIPGCPEFAL